MLRRVPSTQLHNPVHRRPFFLWACCAHTSASSFLLSLDVTWNSSKMVVPTLATLGITWGSLTKYLWPGHRDSWFGCSGVWSEDQGFYTLPGDTNKQPRLRTPGPSPPEWILAFSSEWLHNQSSQNGWTSIYSTQRQIFIFDSQLLATLVLQWAPFHICLYLILDVRFLQAEFPVVELLSQG